MFSQVGQTALHFACRNSRPSEELIELLLQNGADDEILDAVRHVSQNLCDGVILVVGWE